MGLSRFQSERIKEFLKDVISDDKLDLYIKDTTQVFNFLLECLDVDNVDA